MLGKAKAVDPLQAALTAAQLQGDREREQREREKASQGAASASALAVLPKEMAVPTYPVDICE